ncbi:MAG: hypothetical protein IPK66_12445 [Rhodospirillales bacterium]|nr:hypothetical protein [Rhodospirillales bacterium]
MIRHTLFAAATVMALGIAAPVMTAPVAMAAPAAQIRNDAEAALTRLYNQDTAARALGRKAKGILVFPEVTKGGVGIGGSYGEGVLYAGGKAVDYYSIGSGSLGLTLGAQSFSQVIMFMTDDALRAFRTSKGWEAGVDGSVVAIKDGAAASADTTTMDEPVVGFMFNQTGLMFDASFGGSKYTRIRR